MGFRLSTSGMLSHRQGRGSNPLDRALFIKQGHTGSPLRGPRQLHIFTGSDLSVYVPWKS